MFRDKKNLANLIWRCFKWHISYFFTRAPSPLTCGIFITEQCNFKCDFCDVWRRQNPATLPFSKAKRVIDGLSHLGCFYCNITGGEPLLADSLFDLISYIRKSRIRYLHLITNGFLLDAPAARKLQNARLNEISISIDASAQLHDKMRGVPGAYNRAVTAVENLKRHAPDIKIVLKAIFFPANPEECLHVVELARQFNIYVKIQPLHQFPVFDESRCAALLSDRISPVQIKTVIARLRKEGCVINSKISLDNIYNFFCQRKDLIFRNSFCMFGYHHIEILEDGSIAPCALGADTLSLNKELKAEGSLQTFLRSSEYGQVLQELKKCCGCRSNYYTCYYEPRIFFPINNFLRSLLYRQWKFHSPTVRKKRSGWAK